MIDSQIPFEAFARSACFLVPTHRGRLAAPNSHGHLTDDLLDRADVGTAEVHHGHAFSDLIVVVSCRSHYTALPAVRPVVVCDLVRRNAEGQLAFGHVFNHGEWHVDVMVTVILDEHVIFTHFKRMTNHYRISAESPHILKESRIVLLAFSNCSSCNSCRSAKQGPYHATF